MPRNVKYVLYQKGSKIGQRLVTNGLIRLINSKELPFASWASLIDSYPTNLPIPELNKLFKDIAVFINSTVDQSQKLIYLFEKLEKKDLSINICWSAPSSEYNSTALHALITNESYEGLNYFILLAEKYKVAIDFSVTDNEGKTIALTAIKICMITLELIKKMLNKDTIANPDKNGVTPLMLACALGKTDVVNYILTLAKELIEKGILEISFEKFINMQDKQGRTAAHYSLMREGSSDDKEQNTVGGILRSIYIDKDRDSAASRNAFMRTPQNAVEKIEVSMYGASWLPKLRFTSTFSEGEEFKNNGLLVCNQNLPFLQQLKIADNPYIEKQISQLKNKPLAQMIMEQRQSTFKLLTDNGIDLTIKHSSGRTAQEVITSFKARNDLTFYDKKYLLGHTNIEEPAVTVQASSLPKLNFTNQQGFIRRELERITSLHWIINLAKGIAAHLNDNENLINQIFDYLKKFNIEIKKGKAKDSNQFMLQIERIELRQLEAIPKFELQADFLLAKKP